MVRPPGRVLLNAAGLMRLAKREARLPIVAIPERLSWIAAEIAAAITTYAAELAWRKKDPSLAEIAQWGRDIAYHSRAILRLLDVDYRGPEGNIAPHVPIPWWLISDPARLIPGIDLKIAVDSGEGRGIVAKSAMQEEIGIRLPTSSIYGAHDLVRVVVASLRQLTPLAETAAKHASMVRPTGYDLAAVHLFSRLAGAYEQLHGQKFTVSNRVKVPPSGRDSVPAGPAMRWTQALFKLVAARAVGMDCEVALMNLAVFAERKPDALARRIRDTHPKPNAPRRHFYRPVRRA